MRSLLIAVLAVLAIATSVGALVVSWEYGPTPKMAQMPVQEGRAALSTDPERPDF